MIVMFTNLNLHSLGFRTDDCDDIVAWTRIGDHLRKILRRLWEVLNSPGRIAGVRFFQEDSEI